MHKTDYEKFVREKLLPRLSNEGTGKCITQADFKRLVILEWGSDFRTWKKHIRTLELLGYVYESGISWCMPLKMHGVLTKSEEVNVNADDNQVRL